MTRISLPAKVVLCAAGVLGLLAYLLIVDLGVNAGLIHRGVQVGHIDVGGLSQPEAAAEIQRIGTLMRDEEIALEIEGVATIFVSPRDFGWKPLAARKAEAAMRVGRDGSMLAAVSDRITTWFGGRRIAWDEPRPRALRRQIKQIIRSTRLAGVEVSWSSVRKALLDATYDWPRRTSYRVAVASGP